MLSLIAAWLSNKAQSVIATSMKIFFVPDGTSTHIRQDNLISLEQVPTKPIAWVYDLATRYDAANDRYEGWEQFLTLYRPTVDPRSIRNLTPLISGFLVSDDGKFTVHYDQAIKNSYLLNCAEAAIMRDTENKYENGHIIMEYCAGDLTWDEAMITINEDIAWDDTTDA